MISTPTSEVIISYYVDHEAKLVKDKIKVSADIGGTYLNSF